MTALTLNQEFGQMRGRFQRTLAMSVALHAALLLLLLAVRDLAPPVSDVIEITWLEQTVPSVIEPEVVPEPDPVVTAPVESVPEQVEPVLTVREKLARRGADGARIRQKLGNVDPAAITDRAATALDAAAPRLVDAARATMAPNVANRAPARLNRGPSVDQPAVALTRGPVSSHRAAAVAAELPSGPTGQEAVKPAADAGGAARDLGGATLSGLVADRRVLHHVMPDYPSWARSQAVEATVTLYFIVLPNGDVKPAVQVQKTAGFQDFDRNATEALRQWRFEPLTGGEAREQWGTITFRYRLND